MTIHLVSILLNDLEEVLFQSTCKVKMSNIGGKKNAVGVTSGLIARATKWDRVSWEVVLTNQRFVLDVPSDNDYGNEISFPIANIDNVKIYTPVFSKEKLFDIFEVASLPNQRKITIYDLADPEKWKSRIMDLKEFEKNKPEMRRKIAQMLNSQEVTTFEEIKEITKTWLTLVYGQLENKSPHDLDRIISTVISDVKASNGVQVFVNKDSKTITHKNVLDRKTEHVETVINASFTFGSDGAIQIQCPYCKNSDKPKSRTSEMTCSACGKQYVVPSKILSMM